MDCREIGLLANHSHHNEFYHNEMLNSGIALTGDFDTFTTQTIPENNTVNGLPVYYLTNIDMGGDTLTGDHGQVILGNVTDLIVENLNIDNGTAGLGMGYCTYIAVRNSKFSHHIFGMYMENTTNSDIHNNTFWYNKEYGLYIGEGSHSNHIYANSFVGNNGAGEQFNESHVQACDDGYDNLWNASYPKGGNYWSDWIEPDEYGGPGQEIDGRDGIVDEPYTIDGNATDNYPLVYPTYPIPPTHPEDLQAHVGHSYVNLSWDEPFHDGNIEVTHYRIYKGSSYDDLDHIGDSPDLWFQDTDVVNSIEYYYSVTAVNDKGESSPTNISAMPGSHPTPPQGTSISSGHLYIDLSWNEPSDDGGFDTTEYRIYRGNSSGELVFYDNVTHEIRTYNDADVENWQTYYYHITAVNERGESPPGEEVFSTPMPPADTPEPPINIVAKTGNQYINITWDTPVNTGNRSLVEYRIYRGTSSGDLSLLDSVQATVLYYNDTDVENGIRYYYGITSVNEAYLESGYSDEIEAKPYGPPSQPVDLKAIEGFNNVTITWNPPSEDGGSEILGYKLYRTHDGNTELLTEMDSDTMLYFDEDVAFNTTYGYSISAVNAAGEGQKSEEISLTVLVWHRVPSQPVNVEALPGNSRVLLSWGIPEEDGGSDILGYRIYKGTRTGNLQLYDTFGNTTFDFIDTDVQNERTYYYSIEAYNGVGNGVMSSEYVVVPDGIRPTLRIISPSDNIEIEDDSITIYWEGEDENSGISYYEIRLGAGPWIPKGNDTEHTFENLSPGDYRVYIRAYDNAGNDREESISFRIVSKAVSPLNLGSYWWLALILIGVSVLGIGVMLYRKHSSDKGKYVAVIEEVFLISNSALLISHNTRRLKPDMDDDILAGMLTAVQNFIKDSFKEEGDWRLNKLEFADNKILVERGKYVYIAVLYSGELDERGLEKIRNTIAQIEGEYEEFLKDWDGNMNDLRGIKDKLRDLF